MDVYAKNKKGVMVKVASIGGRYYDGPWYGDYASYLKGLTVYRAGAKEGEPLQAIPLTKENIEKNMGVKHEAAVQTAEMCSITGGGCGG